MDRSEAVARVVSKIGKLLRDPKISCNSIDSAIDNFENEFYIDCFNDVKKAKNDFDISKEFGKKEDCDFIMLLFSLSVIEIIDASNPSKK